MNLHLRQSTAAQSRTLGPFVDDADFKTPETALTIANTDIKLLKNGAASVDKNSGGGTHRVNGEYGVTFDATDSDTVGELKVSVVVAGALSVFVTYVVLEEAVYDQLYAAAAPGAATVAALTVIDDFLDTEIAAILSAVSGVEIIGAGYIGDIDPGGSPFDIRFETKKAGVLTTLVGSPAVSAYKDNSTTQLVGGTSLVITVDFDGVVGHHNLRVTPTVDGVFYSGGSNVTFVLTAGTVGGVAAIGAVGACSLHARSPMRPTTAGRTADVTELGAVTADNMLTAEQVADAVALRELIVGQVLDKTGYAHSSASIIAFWAAAVRELSASGNAAVATAVATAVASALAASFTDVLARVPTILATALGSEYLGTVTGAATATTLIDAGLTQPAVDHWKDRVIIFLTGALAKQAKRITGFDPTTDTLTFEAFTGAPSAADTYLIV